MIHIGCILVIVNVFMYNSDFSGVDLCKVHGGVSISGTSVKYSPRFDGEKNCPPLDFKVCLKAPSVL